MFCALLEFALVNYASRSDMQRDRARERMERARRQWELENAAEMEAAAHDAAAVAAQGTIFLSLSDNQWHHCLTFSLRSQTMSDIKCNFQQKRENTQD